MEMYTPIKGRKYATHKLQCSGPLAASLEPLLVGRVPSLWLARNGREIPQDDFYNFNLTEDDLKKKYSHLT